MYNIPQLQKGLTGLVGFMPNTENSHIIPKSLLKSSSGLYVNEVHEMLNYRNLLSAIPMEKQRVYKAHNSANTYGIGDVVSSEGKLYYSLVASNVAPLATATAWEETSILGEELRHLLNAGVKKMMVELFTQKKLDGRSKAVLQDTKLFGSVGNRVDIIIKRSRFCGLEIIMEDYRDISLAVYQIGLQLTQDNPELNLYLYHTSKSDPVALIPVSAEPGYDFSWSPIDALALKESMSNHSFILGYYESDLTGQAIDISREWTEKPCSACNQYDAAAYKAWSKYIKIHAFEVSSANIKPDRTLFEMRNMVYTQKSNYGLNLRVGVNCDVTDAILRNKTSLAAAVYRMVGVSFLEKLAYNSQIEANAEANKNMARYILEPGGNSKGAKSEARDTIRALDLDLSAQNSACMQAQKQRGVTTGAVR